MFHREGRRIIPVTLLLSSGIWCLTFLFIPWGFVQGFIAIVLLVFNGLILNFFRNPKRAWLQNDNLVVCPCDGKVVVIEKVMKDPYFKEDRIQISIFMSPLNVHVNRMPISGTITHMKYFPGKYLVAWNPKSSTENEQTFWVVENEKGSIGFKQIAGALARRICWYVKEGYNLKQSQEFGFIRFGSRMDIILPVNAKVLVQLEQKVQGGVTPLASFS